MPRTPRSAASTAAAARLKVLAAGDERAFAAYALELLDAPQRLDREAALEALVERPLASVRDRLRALYNELDADGNKRDQGAIQRTHIVRILRSIGDRRDIAIAARASETSETAFGEDITWQLRAHALRMLAEMDPESFPYYAVEHLDDANEAQPEPAKTAFQLLDATQNYVPVYQWLIGPGRESPQFAGVLELFTAAPTPIVRRLMARLADDAARRGDEPICTVIAESIVNLEIEGSYPALERILNARISTELYNYVAVLLAATNRAPLLAILERELHRGRHSRIVEQALRVRTTPEQAAILQRWDDGEELP